MTVSSRESRPVSDEKIERARNIIRQAMREAGGSAIIAYSGGKDGLTAGLLARDLGLTDGCCDESFYFDRQKDDVRAQAVKLGMSITYYDRLDYEWLAARERMCFPHRDTKSFNDLCQHRQRTTMEIHARARNVPVIITGRKQHGNSVRAPIYSKSGGFVMCHPIYDWRDQDVWGFLSQRGVPVPWVYSTAVGEREGNTPWILFRKYADMEQNWRAVASVDLKPMKAAAKFNIRGASDYLRKWGVQ